MKRILFVNPFGIGDVLFTLVAVEAVRKKYPDAFIGFLCNERSCGLVRLNPSIDRTFVFNRDRFRRLWVRHPLLVYKKIRALMALIKEDHFDTLFDVSLGREFAFFAMLAGIRTRIGFDFKRRGLFLTQKKSIAGYEGAPVAEMQLGLLKLLGISYEKIGARIPFLISESSKAEMRRTLAAAGMGDAKRVIAVVPGGGKSWGQNAHYKQWDADRFVETANQLGEQTPSSFLILGGADEIPLLRSVSGKIKHRCLQVAGEPFERVCAALLHCQFLLGNDGGLVHLAHALGVKTVSIFGPVDEKVYGPYALGPGEGEIVTEEVPCRPCYHRFRFPPCAHDRQCLDKLSVGKVLEAIKRIDS